VSEVPGAILRSESSRLAVFSADLEPFLFTYGQNKIPAAWLSLGPWNDVAESCCILRAFCIKSWGIAPKDPPKNLNKKFEKLKKKSPEKDQNRAHFLFQFLKQKINPKIKVNKGACEVRHYSLAKSEGSTFPEIVQNLPEQHPKTGRTFTPNAIKSDLHFGSRFCNHFLKKRAPTSSPKRFNPMANPITHRRTNGRPNFFPHFFCNQQLPATAFHQPRWPDDCCGHRFLKK
jgi:hypothetical protein